MKKVLLLTISILLLFTFVSCYYEPAVEHIHSFTEEYEVRGEELYKIEKCECGDKNETKVENAIVAAPLNAQEKLDALNSGEILYLTKGDYPVLKIRNSKDNSVYYLKKSVEPGIGYPTYGFTFDPEATKYEDVEKEKFIIYNAVRRIENIKLIAEEGSTFKKLSLDATYVCTGGTTFDPIRGESANSSEYFPDIFVKNLTIDGLNFVGDQKGGHIDFCYRDTPSDSYMDGLTIKNCTFTGVTIGAVDNQINGIRLVADNGTNNVFRNVVIDNIKVNNAFQGVYVVGAQNVSITNSEIDTTKHNAISLQSVGDNVAEGKNVIKNNTLKDIGDRVIRLAKVKDADILITNNKILGVCGDGDELLKTGACVNTSLTFSDNTYDGGVLGNVTVENGNFENKVITK